MPILKTESSTLSYERVGNGPPVLLLQGVGLTGQAWAPQVDALSKQYDVVTLDNRGIGKSLPVQGDITIEAMAADARALLDHLGWESAHVAGHSMGGVIAHQLAMDAPQRVRSLSLLCTVPRGKDASKLTLDVLWMGIRTSLGTKAMRRNAFLDLVMPQAYLATVDRVRLAEHMATIFGRDLAAQPSVAFKQVRALSKHDNINRLGELASIPTLVVSGTHDRVTLAKYGRELAERIGTANYVEIPDGGHAVVIQKADEINRLLLEHLAAAERSTRAPVGS